MLLPIESKQRAFGLVDAIEHVRRARSCAAVLAAQASERDPLRESILVDAHRKLNAVLHELQALV
jgi:hypothetical protein